MMSILLSYVIFMPIMINGFTFVAIFQICKYDSECWVWTGMRAFGLLTLIIKPV